MLKLRNIFFAFWFIYFGLLWGRQLTITSQGMMAGSDRTWADGAAHLSYISSFVERGFILPEHPLYKGVRFSYPPASDWLAAILVVGGLSLPMAFCLVGFFLSILTIFLLYHFYLRLAHGKILAAIISSFLFLWNGGFGFVLPFFTNTSSPGSLKRLTELPEFGIRFINTIDAELLPQRAFLLGLPIGLLLCIIIWNLWQKQISSKLILFTAGFVGGVLPIAHPHTFIVMIVVVFWTALYFLFTNIKQWKLFLHLFIPFIVLGGMLTFFATRGLSEHFFWIKWGWLANDFELPWLWFWFINWGLWGLLSLVGFVRASKKIQLFLLPFLGLFLLANVVVFQPYDWDNSKILTWTHLAFSGVAGIWLTTIWDKKSLIKKLIVALLFIISILSGMHDSMQLLNYSKTSIQLFDQEELILANWVKNNTNSNAIFLTSDTHRHFIPALTGRQIIMGYRGWLWSYGIDYSPREKDVLAMYAGGENALALLDNYAVDYVIIGPAEKDSFYQANEKFFFEHFPQVFQSSTTTIYSIIDY